MKKFIICWLFFLIPMVSSAYDFEKDGFYYSVISKEDKTCQIYGGTNDHKEGDLVIPATVTHNDTTFSVIAISGFGRYSSKSGYIKSVIIPEGVKIIKKNAFELQTQLNFVSLPNSVERIEQSAFGRCPLSKMRKLIMPKNLKYLGYNAFCEEMYAINESIVTIVIQEKLDSIDAFAFSAMHNLQKVVFLTNKAPTSFDSSGRTYGPFYDCGTPILYSCWSDGNWKGLAGEKYEYISNYFEEDGITYIPTSISPMTCDVIDCDYSSNISTSINIPSEVTHSGVTFKVNNIRRYAFKSNEYIKEVICNNNGSIDESAFADCSSLVNITFGDNVTSIGSNILEDCTNISKVVLGQSINTIPNKAFANCESLTEVTYNGNVKALGQSAFENCYNLYRFNFPDNLEIINHSTFLNCKKLEKIVIPNTVTRIESLAFSGCESIEDVDIPSSVTSLGNSIFEGCTGLKTVKVGDGLTSLNAIFKGCTSLNEIVIGNNIKTIEESAFEDLTSLGTLVIPNHVEKIGNKAFKGCVSLKNLTFEKSETTLLLGYNKSDIFEIGQSTFSDCPLETVYLGRNLSYESSSNYGYSPFYGISTLKDVSFDNSIVVLSENLFYNCNNLTTVKIPDSVTNIENSVFNGCSGLTSVIFLNPSPVAITEQVFSNRANATLYVPAGSKAAYEAADYWKEFKEIVEQINNNITFADSNVKAICVNHWDTNGDGEISLDEAAAVTTLSDFFKNNTSITSFDELVYFTGLTNIGNLTFLNNHSLTSITFPNSVTSIGIQAFGYCRSLISINIPNSVTSIGIGAFMGCSNLTSIIVESENSIYDSRDNCQAIIETATNKLIAGCKNTTIPNSVTSISDYAFYRCWGLSSITIPNSVTSIGNFAFEDCGSLNSVTVLNSIPAAITGQVFSNRANATLYVPYGSKDAYEIADYWKEFKNIVELANGNITFADSNVKAVCVEHWDADHDGEISFVEAALVKDLSDYFYRNTSITSFDELAYFIGLTSIGDLGFCSALTCITIPNSVTSIEKFAFYGCSGLTSITIPNSVTSIGIQAFDGCSSLTTITIPTSVTNIGVNLFYGCSGLTSIVVESGNPKYDSRDNCNAIIETETNKLIIGCGKTIIPNSVTSIQGYAFYGCSGLTSITIPNSVTSIGRSAFYKVSGLEKVIVNDIASWCNISFEDFSSNPLYFAHHLYSDDNTEITDLVIPSGVTNIGSNAFGGCNVLTSITIPNSVTSIGGRAFLNCSGLTSITIPNSVTSIGDQAFWGCNGLSSIVVESDNTKYDSRENCNAIIETATNELVTGCKTTTIPNSVTSIGNDAFSGCSALTSITIPNGVTNIGEAAFASCSGLTSVTVLNPSPVDISEYVFTNRANATLYVPTTASKAAYEAADYWKEFKEIISSYISGDANDDGSVNVSDIVEMVNYIMNNASSRFLKEAADMNKDGEVNVTDIVSVVDVIMSDGHANSRAAIVDEDTSSDYLTLNESSNNLLSLTLHNQANYVASQFVVSLSEGMTLENISLNNKRGGDHALVYSKEADNQYRVLIFSLNNSSFAGNDGELLSIKTSGRGNVSIDDIIFVTRGIKTRSFSSIGYGEDTTGIEKVETSETMDIYYIDGRLIRRQATNTNGLPKGIYIVNGKKCVVK